MINRKLAKVLALRYMFLALILILLAGGLLLLPKFEKHEGIPPEALLANLISPERYISTDDLAAIYVNQDPSYRIVDVRDKTAFDKYHLPNSINIPLSQLLTEESEAYLDQNRFHTILISNDNFIANQAWVLCNRLNYENLYVLKGGLNEWFNTIINPTKPTEDMPATAFELYSFRKASSMFFGVAYPEAIPVIKKQPAKKKLPKKVIPKKKKKKMPIEGGC